MQRTTNVYVTHRDTAGDRGLVFGAPTAPAAGLQVPAGTADTGELPEVATPGRRIRADG